MKKTIQSPFHHIGNSHSQLKQLLATLILALVISPSAMSSGIYKWTDESGKVHYGSQRPEDTSAEKMELHVPSPAKPPEQTEEEENENKAGLSVDDKAQQERDIYCTNERNRLKKTEKSKQIHVKDSEGNVRKLASADRQKRLDKIRANISKYCK